MSLISRLFPNPPDLLASGSRPEEAAQPGTFVPPATDTTSPIVVEEPASGPVRVIASAVEEVSPPPPPLPKRSRPPTPPAQQREQLLDRLKRGANLEGSQLDGVDLSGADLDGAKLAGARLRQANLRATRLRRASLAKADLRGANLENADLSGADLEEAILIDADLTRANLGGARLKGADLAGARLGGAQLHAAILAGAKLADAALARADLERADLTGAKAVGADFSSADLRRAALADADLTRANLTEATLVDAKATGARLGGVALARADLRRADLSRADLSQADLRGADLAGAVFRNVSLTGARVAGISPTGIAPEGLEAAWIDASPDGNGSDRLSGEDIVRRIGGVSAATGARRYFGPGDVVKNATLELGDGASVQVDSRLESCTLQLGERSELVVGSAGLLLDCRIIGGKSITIEGRLLQGEAPAVTGAAAVAVSATGVVVGTIEQGAEPTRFSFERGCRLRLDIGKPGRLEGGFVAAGEEADRANVATVIAAGAQAKGTIDTDSALLIRGRMEGEVSAGLLEVAAGGVLSGKARSTALRSRGEVSGEFQAEGVELSGRIADGTVIRAQALTVEREPGALFGACKLIIGEEPTRDEGTPDADA